MPLLNVVAALIPGWCRVITDRLLTPLASSIKSILNIVVGVWVLQTAGLWSSITSFRIGD